MNRVDRKKAKSRTKIASNNIILNRMEGIQAKMHILF